MAPKTSFLTKPSKGDLKSLAIIIFLIILLNLLDEFVTLYAFWCAPFAGMAEIGPLADKNQTVNVSRVVQSTVFTITVLLFILTIAHLWRYKIIRVFLWILLISEIVVLVHNFCYGYINGYTQMLIPLPQSLLNSLIYFARFDLIPFLLSILPYAAIILLLKYYYRHHNEH